jgi:hypothetical protein
LARRPIDGLFAIWLEEYLRVGGDVEHGILEPPLGRLVWNRLIAEATKPKPLQTAETTVA